MTRPNLTFLDDPRDETCFEIERRVLSADRAAALMFADPETQDWLQSLNKDQLDRYRRVFRQAGLAGLAYYCHNDGWIQFALTPEAGKHRVIYMVFMELLADAMSQFEVRNCGFMHDGDEVTLRMQADTKHSDALFDLMSETAQSWCEAGLVQKYRRDVYEPEELLFGGTASMPFVQEMVSCEAAFWMAFHCSKAAPETTARVALVLLRHIFGGLDILGWEDIDIWTKVCSKINRVIPGGVGIGCSLSHSKEALTHFWQEPIWTLSQFPSDLSDSVEEAGFQLAGLASKWKTNFFDAGQSNLGLRNAAALYALYLLNRSGLSAQQQHVIATTLATRKI